MAGKTKNQHYVPQMYLKRFSDDGRHIDVWNIQKDIIAPRQNPSGYAAKRYFYDVDPVALKLALSEMEKYYSADFTRAIETDEQFIEHGLAKSEGEIASIFQDIDADHSLIHREDIRSKLTIFIHDLAYRTEAFRNQMDAIYKLTKEAISQMNLDPEQFDDLHTGQEIQTNQILGLTPVLRTAAQLENYYTWHFAITKGSQSFIVSDNPAAGIAFGVNDICFPISQKTAIVFRINDCNAPIFSKDVPNKDNEIILSEASVLIYNLLQRCYAYRFVFGEKENLQHIQQLYRLTQKQRDQA